MSSEDSSRRGKGETVSEASRRPWSELRDTVRRARAQRESQRPAPIVDRSGVRPLPAARQDSIWPASVFGQATQPSKAKKASALAPAPPPIRNTPASFEARVRAPGSQSQGRYAMSNLPDEVAGEKANKHEPAGSFSNSSPSPTPNTPPASSAMTMPMTKAPARAPATTEVDVKLGNFSSVTDDELSALIDDLGTDRSIHSQKTAPRHPVDMATRSEDKTPRDDPAWRVLRLIELVTESHRTAKEPQNARTGDRDYLQSLHIWFERHLARQSSAVIALVLVIALAAYLLWW